MDKREDLLKDTFEIRERLPELLGDVWRKTDRDLGHLLARHLAGEDVEGDIIDLLLRHKPIKEWIEGQAGSRTFHYLTGKYDPLPGGPTSTPQGIRKFVCPAGGCTYAWILHKPGQPVPLCPIHDLPLREV